MIERIISIGDKIDIERTNPETKEKYIYKSQVFDIKDNDEVYIAMPFEGTKLVVMSLNIRYKMCFYTPNGLFECMGLVVDRFKSDNRYVAVISLKTGLKKIQRREFFRLEKLIDVDYRPLSEEESNCESVQEIMEMEKSMPQLPVYKKGIAVDLSGGGARFVLEDAYPADSYLIMKLHLGEGLVMPDFDVIGKVVMSEKMPGKTGQCENRVEFVRIKERDRERLIQYIFTEERKLSRTRKS